MDRLDIEIRLAEDESRQSPGLLTGTLVVYGERARRLPERLLPGALVWPPGGININEMHVRERPVVRVTPFLDGNELRIAQPLPNTSAGRDAAENLRTGVYTGLSVEFRRGSVKAQYVNGIREISHAELIGGALVDLAEYPGSTAEVRYSDSPDVRPKVETLWL